MTIDDTRKKWLALIVLCLGDLLIVLDVSIVNVALPSIREDLGFTESSLAWVLNAYTLTFGGFMLLAGRMGDLYGHRRVFVLGVGLFTLASLACGLATSQEMLVGARAIQGIGGAVVAAVALSLIMTLFTEPAERAKAMGVIGFVAAGGGSIGVLAGGIITDLFSWHWIFLVNIPIGIGVIVACLVLLPGGGARPADGRLDVAGAVLVTGSLMVAVYAIVNGNEQGWTSTQTLGLLAVAVAGIGAFVFRRVARRGAADAARPLQAPQRRHLEHRRHPLVGGHVRDVLPLGALPAARARIQPAPGRPGLPAREPDHGRLLARALGEDRDALRHAAAPRRRNGVRRRSGSRSSRALRSTPASRSTSSRAMVVLGVGIGIAMNPLLLAAMSDVKPEESGLASGIVNTSFMMGGALGLAVLASVAAARTGGDTSPAALTDGYHAAFLIGAVFAAAAGTVAAVFMRDVQMRAGAAAEEELRAA